ncbi:MAG TPA: D-alanine--D-alanine ligase [Tepidisphaeraceae bacterium]|jgi:D-alanine-D-alanine ligase
MNITVLFGGPSAEREVSLVSGRAVASALREAGHNVYTADINPDDLSALDHPAEVIFPVLHGQWGESGELQQILEQRDLPFVGSGSKASRLGMNKISTKKIWHEAGLPSPAYAILTREFRNNRSFQSLGLPSPCVIKAPDSGSSIDVFICKTPEQAEQALSSVLSRHEQALVEQFIDGPELTVGLLEEEPLDPILIKVQREFFDYEAKYKGCGTQHLFETGLPAKVLDKCRKLARQANDLLGCRDLARVDMMLDSEMNPYLLEINTIPGFTPTSLLPEAAAHSGVPFVQLVDRLARRAAARHKSHVAAA